jgi:Fe-S-cluster containining protein
MNFINRIILNIITFLKGKRCRPEDKCGFLRYKNKRAICQAYTRRPAFCRAYPAEPGDLIEGCGYYFTKEE